MEIDIKNTLRNACQALLRPIAAVLLRSGMTWKEFADLSKGVFVSVASEEFGIRGRPTNVSRVSILTGISRKEVKRQRELLKAETLPASSKTTDATRILSGWYNDADYTDSTGKPLRLAPDGPRPSFRTLFEEFGGDTPEQTMVRELTSAGSVTIGDNGLLAPQRRYHMPGNMDVGNLRFFGTNLFDHAQTLSNNLSDDGSPKRLEGFAIDHRVRSDAVEEFRDFVDERGQKFLEEIDDWLTRHQVESPGLADSVRLGLGIYAIEGSLPKGTLS